MNYIEAFSAWTENERPAVVAKYGNDDTAALSESWNNFTDYLCKTGEFTNLQYHHCPSFDDGMPDDTAAEIEYLLEAMGVTIEAATRCENPNWLGGEQDADTRHFLVTIHRGKTQHQAPFSMGPKAGDGPEIVDVLYCLTMDAQNVENVDSFEEYAEELCLDADSRKQKRGYKTQVKQAKALRAMFADVSTDDFNAMFEGY